MDPDPEPSSYGSGSGKSSGSLRIRIHNTGNKYIMTPYIAAPAISPATITIAPGQSLLTNNIRVQPGEHFTTSYSRYFGSAFIILYADLDLAFFMNANPDPNPGLKIAKFFQSKIEFHAFIK
jgi:hypothetical protein